MRANVSQPLAQSGLQRAVKADLDLVVDVLDYAFYGIAGRQPSADRFQDRVRRGMLRLGQRIALRNGEVYFAQHAGADIVLNVGQRGTLRSSLKQAVSFGPVILFVVVVWGAIFAASMKLGLPAGAPEVLLLVVLGGPLLLVARMVRVPDDQREGLPEDEELTEEKRIFREEQARELAEQPSFFQRYYRRGAPRPYWLVATFGARPSALQAGARRTKGAGAGMVAAQYVKVELPRLLGPDETVVCVARNTRLRKVYSWLGFEPLGGSKWVLIGRTTRTNSVGTSD